MHSDFFIAVCSSRLSKRCGRGSGLAAVHIPWVTAKRALDFLVAQDLGQGGLTLCWITGAAGSSGSTPPLCSHLKKTLSVVTRRA